MTAGIPASAPVRSSYDVVIVGGAIHGTSTAWWLMENPDFDGSVLVVEMDPAYEKCSTAHTNSCIRQQYSSEINVRISQFGAEFIHNFRRFMGDDPDAPQPRLQNFGYMYLASDEGFANALRESHKVQVAAGAGTKLMTADEIKQAYPFYNVDDIVLGSHNTVDEGYWEGAVVFDWMRRSARKRGAEYVTNRVVGMTKNAAGDRVESVTLETGEVVACGQVVNASGPRAVLTARMAGIEIPVEPRKRYTWIFSAEKPLDQELPLTIDPTGVHVRENGGGTYQGGGHREDEDPAVDYDDFSMDHDLWEEKIWPTLAARIPAFEAVKVSHSWAGHYAYNTLDHNAILGPHDQVKNFIFQNGFSGHGLQQSPATGRAISEILTYGEFRTLDLSCFGYDRIVRNEPFLETAII